MTVSFSGMEGVEKEELEKVCIDRFLEESCEREQISGIVARGVWVFTLKIQLERAIS